MRQDRDKHIEDACATMAAALAQLVAAVSGRAGTTAGSTMSVAPAAPERAQPAVDDPTTSTNSIDGSHDRATSCRRINVYLAGSRGCATIARTYGARIMAALDLDKAAYVIKCGTTTGDLAERLRQIGQDQYGAAVRTKDGIKTEAGFSGWIAHTISTSRQPRDPAVTLRPRAIAVDLPTGLTRRGFDAALHRALEGRSLASIPGRDVPRRFVAYDLVEPRVSAATELYALSPHDGADGDLLLDVIEDILSKARARRA